MRLWLSIILLFALSLAAQQPSASSPPAQGSVRYSFDWSQGYPWQKYTIDVESGGKAHFDGMPHADETNDTDPYQQDFTMSEANRQKVFELAQKLNYFQGDFDSHLKNIAKTGTKTLQYDSAQLKGSTSFNWSRNADIEELVRFFGAVSMTIDYGRKLTFQYRFDKLGMDKRMKELEDLQASHGVEELGIIKPILRKIATDPNLMNISRESARKLLLSLDQPAPVAQAPTQAEPSAPSPRQ
jgi:hypothetical protein